MASLLRTFEPGESLLHVYLKGAQLTETQPLGVKGTQPLELNGATQPLEVKTQPREVKGAPDGGGQAGGALEDASTLSVEYPRFDLSFDLERGQLRSKSSFLGTRLAARQLLPDVLRGFEQYLLLEHDAGHVTVLVPEGNVEKHGDGAACVTVSGDPACDVERRFHDFSVHPRFMGLQAKSVEARLQLAALYAATGTRLPEPRTQMTGGEAAIEMVRQSWVSRPLSDAERAQLHSVKRFSQRTPGLAMVCDGLDVSAAELAFLYTPQPPKPVSLDVEAQAEYVERKQGRSAP